MSTGQFIGAIDQGTTSSRFIIFNRDGGIVAMDQREHRQILPQPGWVEHDPEEIWRNVQAVIVGALAKAGLRADDLAGVGLTNQRETAVVWDRRSGKPLANAIVWMDTRTDRLVAQHRRDGGESAVRAKTGLPLASYFSALKWRAMLDADPDLRGRAEGGDVLFGTIDSWLAWNLTGAHVTDVTNAARTQLMDLRSLDWDDGLLDLFGIPRICLPAIRSSSEFLGDARAPLAGAPLAGMLGDQHAALLGQACLKPGQAKNTYGTGCFLLMNTGEQPIISTSGLITTLAWKLGDAPAIYALEGSIAIAGALVQWLRDNLGLIASSDEIEALAASVPDNGDVYFVPAFSGLYAPWWRPDARGVIAGLTRFANKGHLARAAIEATAYQTREALDAMAADAGAALPDLRVDGGMTANSLLMQFQSDILGVPVVRPRVTETTAAGAAYAAGLTVGFWTSPDEIAAHWREDRRWTPAMGEAAREKYFARWKKAVRRSFDWVE